jgi:hypothetical protein
MQQINIENQEKNQEKNKLKSYIDNCIKTNKSECACPIVKNKVNYYKKHTCIDNRKRIKV